jgi:hypothetical protein
MAELILSQLAHPVLLLAGYDKKTETVVSLNRSALQLAIKPGPICFANGEESCGEKLKCLKELAI